MDETVIREVWDDQVYSPPHIKSRVNAGTVIDIGAHIGTFTIFAITTGLARRVICYEPYPPNFQVLQKNISVNKLRDVSAYSAAVLDHRGVATLYSPSLTNTGAHSFYVKHGSASKVATITLGDVFSHNGLEECELLKIDTEGSEYSILSGASQQVLDKVKTIAMEYHVFDESRQEQLEDLLTLLNNRGFLTSLRHESKPNRGIMYAVR